MDTLCKDGLTVREKINLIEKKRAELRKLAEARKIKNNVIIEINGRILSDDTAFNYSCVDKELLLYTDDEHYEFNSEDDDMEIIVRVNSGKAARDEIEKLRDDNKELQNLYYTLCEKVVNTEDMQDKLADDIRNFGGALSSAFTSNTDFHTLVNMMIKEHKALVEKCKELLDVNDRQSSLLAEIERNNNNVWG